MLSSCLQNNKGFKLIALRKIIYKNRLNSVFSFLNTWFEMKLKLKKQFMHCFNILLYLINKKYFDYNWYIKYIDSVWSLPCICFIRNAPSIKQIQHVIFYFISQCWKGIIVHVITCATCITESIRYSKIMWLYPWQS